MRTIPMEIKEVMLVVTIESPELPGKAYRVEWPVESPDAGLIALASMIKKRLVADFEDTDNGTPRFRFEDQLAEGEYRESAHTVDSPGLNKLEDKDYPSVDSERFDGRRQDEG